MARSGTLRQPAALSLPYVVHQSHVGILNFSSLISGGDMKVYFMSRVPLQDQVGATLGETSAGDHTFISHLTHTYSHTSTVIDEL